MSQQLRWCPTPLEWRARHFPKPVNYSYDSSSHCRVLHLAVTDGRTPCSSQNTKPFSGIVAWTRRKHWFLTHARGSNNVLVLSEEVLWILWVLRKEEYVTITNSEGRKTFRFVFFHIRGSWFAVLLCATVSSIHFLWWLHSVCFFWPRQGEKMPCDGSGSESREGCGLAFFVG